MSFPRTSRRRVAWVSTPSLSLFIFVVCVTVLSAQINRGVIEGVVTDPAGAVVPETQVTITATDTNLTTVIRTNSTGYYRVVDLLRRGLSGRASPLPALAPSR